MFLCDNKSAYTMGAIPMGPLCNIDSNVGKKKGEKKIK